MQITTLCENCQSPEVCVARFREIAKSFSLEITLDGSLSQITGSTHLHLRKRGEKTGVLEYTMAPQSRRAWLSSHSNRTKPWVEESVKSLLELSCPKNRS